MAHWISRIYGSRQSSTWRTTLLCDSQLWGAGPSRALAGTLNRHRGQLAWRLECCPAFAAAGRRTSGHPTPLRHV